MNRRVVVIIGVWLGLLLATAAAYVALEGDAAAFRGRRRYRYRVSLERQLQAARLARPSVVWLGDSTILGLREPSYPHIVRGAVPKVSSRVIGFLGCDFFTYYPVVAGLLAEHRPAVLVMVAHLRLFRAATSRTSRNDLVSLVPADGLMRAARLPFATRGLTMPRLLLTRLLRFDAVERALYLVEGARVWLSEAQIAWLGPRTYSPPGSDFLALAKALAASNVRVTDDHPTVRMMAATVRLARDAGVRVVVVATPLPFEAMRDSVGYESADYAKRFAILRDAVEQSGGIFVDLHDALPAERFLDAVGHFDKAGAELLAGRLRPIVARQVHAANFDGWMAAEKARQAEREKNRQP